MKKNEKNAFCNLKKHLLLLFFYIVAPLAFHFKDDL
jgi:hypothetical protein